MEELTLTIRKHKDSEQSADVMLLLDTGVAHAVVPGDVLRKLGIEPDGEERIFVGMETHVRKTGTAFVQLGERGGYAKVMFGEAGDSTVAAKSTLAALGLFLHPFNRELLPLTAHVTR